MIFQYQSCDIQAYTRKDIFTWYFLTGYLDSEAFQYLKWMDGWVRVLHPFNSISVISRRWKGEHERLCAMRCRLGSGRISPPAGFEPATPWFEVGGANRSEYLKCKSFYRKQIPGKSCGEADFYIESKGNAKQKGCTSNSIAIALKFSGSMLTTETAFWPIRMQLSVWGNRCKKSIYEPKLFYIF